MSSKKKSHGVLFTPYLEKGEDLIWVGMPEKNSYINFHSGESFERKLSGLYKALLLIAFPILFWCSASDIFPNQATIGEVIPVALPYVLSFCLATVLLPALFVLPTQIYFGKVYYAITTKRLLVLRRPLWKSLDATALILLPEFHLENHENKTASVLFSPLRIEETYHPPSRSREASFSYVEIHRAHLEKMNQEAAETANELLTAVKNDMLDKRARELGLMD